PVAASRSATGVRATVPPLQPSASKRCWSVVMKRIFRPMGSDTSFCTVNAIMFPAGSALEEQLERPADHAVPRGVRQQILAPGAAEGAAHRRATAHVERHVHALHALYHPEAVGEREALELDAAEPGAVHADAAGQLVAARRRAVGPGVERAHAVE